MPTLEVEGVGKVEVDENFLTMSPEDQQRTVDEIANTSAPTAPKPGGADQDILSFFEGFIEGVPVFGPNLIEGVAQIRARVKGESIEESRAKLSSLKETSPTASTAGSVTGAVLPMLALPQSMFATAPTAASVGGAISGVDVMARGGDASQIATGAALGAVGGAGGVLLGRIGAGVVGRIGSRLSGKGDIAVTVKMMNDDLIESSRKLYAEADAIGMKVDANTFASIVDRTIAPTKKAGEFAPEILAKNTPQVLTVVNTLTKFKDSGKTPTLTEIDQMRQMVGDLAGSTDAGTRRFGVLMKKELTDALDDLTNASFVDKAIRRGVDILKEARRGYRRGAIIDELADAAEKASIANQPLGLALQGRIRQLLNNKNFKLDPPDRTALKVIVSSPEDRVLAMLGQFRTQIGALSAGAIGGGIAESATTGGLVAGTVAGVGSGARGLRGALAASRFEAAAEAIAAGRALPTVAPGSAPGGAIGTGLAIPLVEEGVLKPTDVPRVPLGQKSKVEPPPPKALTPENRPTVR